MGSSMNCNSFRLFIVTLLLSCFSSYSSAQDSTGIQSDSTYSSDYEDSIDLLADVPEDTTLSKTAFNIDNDSLQKWKSSRDFAYIAYLDSLLRNEKDLKMDTVSIDKNTGKKTRKVSSSNKNSGKFLNGLPLQMFFWALAIFFIGFIIYKLFFANGIFAKTNTKIPEEQANIEPEGLNEHSAYENLIREAESKSDYNLSTRYLYLQTLKKLADKDLILYSPEKTNYSYVRELSKQNYMQQFASLTLNYEYVWYGKFVVSSVHYEQLKEQFNSFNKKV
ncbi:MAG: hypothetical protein ABJA90_09520 [Ginsengibacter sp.]